MLAVLKTAARDDFRGSWQRQAGAPLQLLALKGSGRSATCPWDLLLHVCPSCSLLLASRGLMMPRELQEAFSLPSQEQWGHCGRLGKCGQIPGLAVTQLGALCSCQVLSLPPQVGGEQVVASPSVGPGRTLASPATGTPRQHAQWPWQATSLLPIRYVWVQNAVRQPETQSCQMTPACSRPDCELAECCQQCQLHTWVSSRINCAFKICEGMLQEPKLVFLTIK